VDIEADQKIGARWVSERWQRSRWTREKHVSDAEACEIVWCQLGAALAMLRGAIESCPLSLWERPSERLGYWYVAYHSLFFIDHDLHAADSSFESPWFDRHQYELREVPPPYDEPYSQPDLLTYLDQCLTKAGNVLSSLSRGESLDLRGSRRLGLEALEVVLYQLRHVQHHAGQLNAWLRGEGVEPPRWVRRLDGPPL
jgi:hypothetical protein